VQLAKKMATRCKKRRVMSMLNLPDDVQLILFGMLDPITLANFDRTCSLARSITLGAWHFLCAKYFQATLANPPFIDADLTARAKFRHLMQFEGSHRPHWALRMSTSDLLLELHALLSTAHVGFWEDLTDDEAYVDDVCQMLRSLAPIAHTGREIASVDMPFDTYVELFAAHVQELAQRGVVADPWMLRSMQTGDVVDHLDVSGVRRDFWRVMDVAHGVLLLQPLGVAMDAQGHWTSFPKLVTRSQLLFDYFMSANQSAGRGMFTMPVWHTEHRRLSWDFSLRMVYGNDVD
jgi:hypothetical protein